MKLNEANKLRLLYFWAFCCQAAWSPILADYLGQHGIKGFQLAVILNIVPVMFFLVQPLVGLLTDKIGYKKSLLIAAAGAALFFVAYNLQGGFLYLLFITIFMALFYNSVQPVLDSLALKLEKNNPDFSYGSLRIAGAAGWSLMGIINGYLIDDISMNVIFILSAISMIFTFFFALLLKDAIADVAQKTTVSIKALTAILQTKKLLFILIAIFFVSVGATAIWNFYSVYMKENGASATLVGYGLSFQGLCELPLFYFSAVIIKRIGLRNTMLLTVFTTAFRLLLYSVIKNPQWAIAIEVLHGISWSLFWVACVEVVNHWVPEERRATGQSLLYASYFGLGAIVGNFWTSYLQSTHLAVSEIFLLNAGIVAATGLSIGVFIKRWN
jgi:MFS transporter, PPP family, 3-phenylpropionic acid transporter